MIITISLFLILAILIISGVIISKVIKIYLYSSKNKEMWKKEIKEEKNYQFIKGLY
ncbi:hypothetical protein HX030_04195 [Myroides odoratimimus]|uniref:hypothetical protein n=1 Tax=Myroides odoratimimus TaxID=76832 RepID=UPI001402EB8A|nr:hypothetical protein [Myroides odoratimimus]MCA4791985.1 hypothetical protein [Myroides odoratimimus]MCA4805811.1 hypothetical protein [Myroides odoratimimus]MCA4819352.1 hypothetical protein [Myroides odoratimimus]MDM1058419.1 hypothetical protein [Myroides odoratimimus]MDM1092553.1 hypothetical protein [Myroides odoratimimus]